MAKRPLALIAGCAGPRLLAEERAFLRDADPLGFILFARNCEDPDQVTALVAEFRDAVGRANAPVLIDQEGGRVARLKPPHWRAAPPPIRFAELHDVSPDAGIEAARLNARLIAHELAALGISVDCLPVLDIPQRDADPIIGDRAAGSTPDQSAILGRAACEGLLAGGVCPVIKHIPGHGRATEDSHKALPRVDASIEDLRAVDFPPFAALADAPWGMTAHVVYKAIDPDRPATTSDAVVNGVIRDHIGFDGLLLTDDLSMRALTGPFEERASKSLEAGCDVVLHCNGDMGEMVASAKGAAPMTDKAWDRFERGEAMRANVEPLDVGAALARLDALMETA